MNKIEKVLGYKKFCVYRMRVNLTIKKLLKR